MYGSPNITIHFYPLCADPSQLQDDAVVVHADIDSGLPEQIGAAYRASFGLCVWLALILHAVGIELYVSLPIQNRICDLHSRFDLCFIRFPNPHALRKMH